MTRIMAVLTLALLVAAPAAYAHDANADVMTIQTSITFPGKEPIVLTYRANHLGEGKTLEGIVAGTAKPYRGGMLATKVKLSGDGATVEPGEHRFFIGSEGGKMFMQVGGTADGGGARIPMTMETAPVVLEHMQITVNHGDGDNDLKIMFAYGKYRSTAGLIVG